LTLNGKAYKILVINPGSTSTKIAVYENEHPVAEEYVHHKPDEFKDCADMLRNNACCVYDPMDLGIAVGSAVSIAADRRIDNRVFFTAGKAASRLGLLGEAKLIMGIPLAVAGKSPFYDRERRKAD